MEPALGLLVVVAAAGVATVRSRLGAALALGVVGIAVAGLFIAQGAPDLALTQLLVETVVVVGFVIGLGCTHPSRSRSSGSVGGASASPPPAWSAPPWPSASPGAPRPRAVARRSTTSSGRPSTRAAATTWSTSILTDIRALDTLGEIMVLAVVAVGILALARAGRARGTAVIAGRSPIVRQGVLAAGPLAVLVAVYLLFAGHNRPGGGFAAGLVLGAVVALRAAAGLPRPRRAVPLHRRRRPHRRPGRAGPAGRR